jgi:hypothetical protein
MTMKIIKRLWLSPLGIILPRYFKAGSAWGEWGTDEMQKLAGYVPPGLKKLSGIWNAPLHGYAFQGWEDKGLPHLSVAYIASAIAGIAIIILAVWGIGKLLTRKDD